MNKQILINTTAALALLGASQAAFSAHEPSPCAAGNIDAGTSCIYLTTAGNAYDPISGDRSAIVTAGSTITVGLWQDFRPDQTTGGGLNLIWDIPTDVASVSFAYDGAFAPQTFGGGDLGDATANSYDNFGWSNFNGWGGEDQGDTGTDPGFQLVGAFTIQLAAGFSGSLGLSLQEVINNAQNSPFVDENGADMNVALHGLRLTAVPIPAAVWMMLSGLGALAGVARKRVVA